MSSVGECMTSKGIQFQKRDKLIITLLNTVLMFGMLIS